MRLGTATALAALGAATSLAPAGPAAAADLPAYYMPTAPAAAPLVLGAGWYLRGDAAFGVEDRPKLLLQGDVPAFDREGSQSGYAFGAGAGYQFTQGFRADVTADYLDPFRDRIVAPCGEDCSVDRSADAQRWDGLVNGYLDLGTYAGFTPYVGAGVGVGGTYTEGKVAFVGGAQGTVPSRTELGFAWAAMAGVSYAVAPHLLVDVGYRYLALGTTAVSLPGSASVARGLSAQQVRVGLRYMID